MGAHGCEGPFFYCAVEVPFRTATETHGRDLGGGRRGAVGPMGRQKGGDDEDVGQWLVGRCGVARRGVARRRSVG